MKDAGCLVLVGSYKSFWAGDTDWKIALSGIVDKWFRQEMDRIAGVVQKYEAPWEEKLAQYPFSSIESHRVNEERIWTVETLIGFLYSMSFIDRAIVGHEIDTFEQEVKTALLQINPNNQFIEAHEISIILAKK